MKSYISPKVELFQMESEAMLAASPGLKEEVGNKIPLSFQSSGWNSENWSAEESSDIEEQ